MYRYSAKYLSRSAGFAVLLLGVIGCGNTFLVGLNKTAEGIEIGFYEPLLFIGIPVRRLDRCVEKITIYEQVKSGIPQNVAEVRPVRARCVSASRIVANHPSFGFSQTAPINFVGGHIYAVEVSTIGQGRGSTGWQAFDGLAFRAIQG